ncbi:hypothetical protein ACIPQH_24145 [Streptomyces rubiginosohelvolus]|uniref:hypothetical protein n=1 Tax=Streptomyces TaxID=1883 RepID=UPI001CD48C70|nr:hypothetical protein [Streptomyces sp. 7G]MCA1268688.1 hypothetical protein [Streptomyces sp. 7G]
MHEESSSKAIPRARFWRRRARPPAPWRGRVPAWREQLAVFLAMRRIARVIRQDLGLSGVRTMQELVDAIASSRNKPITVKAAPLPLHVSAFCAHGDDRDFIVVDSNASELTRIHGILHELFHLWEEHPANREPTDQPMTDDAVRSLLPGLKPGPALQVLSRSHYDNNHERRAEAFATLMLQRHLRLREDRSTWAIQSALAHRRSGV